MCVKLEHVFFLGPQALVWGTGNLLVKGTQSSGMLAIDSEGCVFAVAAKMELEMRPHPEEALARRHISQEQSLSADARARRWRCAEQRARLPCEGWRRGERRVSPQGNQRTWDVMETAPTEGQGRAKLSHPTPASHVTGLAPGRTGIEADHLLAFSPAKHWERGSAI